MGQIPRSTERISSLTITLAIVKFADVFILHVAKSLQTGGCLQCNHYYCGIESHICVSVLRNSLSYFCPS